MGDKIWDLLKKKLDQGEKADFYELFKKVYDEVSKKAEGNKNEYFSQQNHILGVSAGVSVLNIVVSFLTALNAWSWIISLITSLSAVCAVLVTFLMAKKGTHKYLETWLRHQKNKAAMEEEMMRYIFGTGTYSKMEETEAAQKFTDQIIEIWSRNQAAFVGNMERYSGEVA